MFIEISKNAKKCSQKRYRAINILKILDEVIPFEYFGTKRHKKKFYDIVKLILTQSKYECIYIKELTMGYDVTQIPWLRDIGSISKKIAIRYLADAQLWLLDKMVKPLIQRFYVPVKLGQLYEMELVPRPVWSSFRQKSLNLLIGNAYITPAQGKIVPRGFLQITPKDGYHNPNSFRLIVKLARHPSKSQRRKEKEFARYAGMLIRQVASSLCFTKTSRLYKCWKEYLIALKGTKIYGVKVDVTDAFGNIEIDLMCYILTTLKDLGKIPKDVHTALTRHIKNQFVVCGKNKNGTPKIWKWDHGLCQGDRFSSSLCQLYMSYLDSIHLQHLKRPTTFLHRTVDDYFFCSTEETDVIEFIKIMESLHTLNRDKMQSNITGFTHQTVNYYGRTFNLETGQVEPLYDFRKRTEIRHRFKLWNARKPIYNKDRSIAIQQFLENTMRYSINKFHFQSLELNTVFNTEATVLENYLKAMVYLAFKFDVVVMALKKIIKDFSVVITVINNVVCKYARKSLRAVAQNTGLLSCENLALQQFLKVGWIAFILVFKKRKFYAENLVLDALKKREKRFSHKILEGFGFSKFTKLPKAFVNISSQRRLPHHKRQK